jgi:KUP system potassium uptake protein
MLIDTLLAYVIVRRVWGWRLWQALCLTTPLAIVDLVFVGSNLLKIGNGGWAPLALGAALMLVMWTWTRGTRILYDKVRRDSLPLTELIDMLRARPPHRSPGTAMFLTADTDVAPVALMHNLKHNKTLHQHNIIVTVRTAEVPVLADCDRIHIEVVNEDFKKLTLSYGFMETPNLPRALAQCRKQGLKFDIMATSFFLGRRSLVVAEHSGMPIWQDKLFIFLTRNSANPTDFFHIPPGRVVELGAQVTV